MKITLEVVKIILNIFYSFVKLISEACTYKNVKLVLNFKIIL